VSLLDAVVNVVIVGAGFWLVIYAFQSGVE